MCEIDIKTQYRRKREGGRGKERERGREGGIQRQIRQRQMERGREGEGRRGKDGEREGCRDRSDRDTRQMDKDLRQTDRVRGREIKIERGR